MLRLTPQNPRDRFEVYRFFNGISEEAKEGIDHRRTRVPLAKTFLLEHVSSHENSHVKSPVEILGSLGLRIRMLDETFMAVVSHVINPETNLLTEATTGFLEQYDERFFAYYTSEDAMLAKKRV